MMDKLTAGLLGTPQGVVMNVTVFIPNTAYIPDVLGFLHDAGRPVQGLRRYDDGVDITFSVARNEEGRILSKATARGFIVGGRKDGDVLWKPGRINTP
jgi:hypothetical protein